MPVVLRGGEGLERFYGRLGHEVVGRHPRAVRLSATDLRDEVLLVARVGASGAVTPL